MLTDNNNNNDADDDAVSLLSNVLFMLHFTFLSKSEKAKITSYQSMMKERDIRSKNKTMSILFLVLSSWTFLLPSRKTSPTIDVD